jgi:hypothetical protein
MNPVLVMEKGKGCKILDVRIGLWPYFIRKITYCSIYTIYRT